ncbi:HNH endonuclease family protein [Pseudactinotalea terrae]|uniref:HNH endonuclease family protein n=1 Tax=Pseudactinotalea terrae TaxID=1743262 RepID=UPI0012E14CFD|nr:HNH endonuclease family protein [Pseudactinotalea terrae]
MTRRRLLAGLAVVVLAGLGYVQGSSAFTEPAPELTRTQVRPDAVPDYVREEFGDGWASSNGCDTRNRVLARDLTQVQHAPGSDCVVISGVLVDPYTGQRVRFERGTTTSQQVQIDHVLPLAQAWDAGAYAWTYEQRVAFANDEVNLLAAAGSVNASKSDATLAEYAPQLSGLALCEYVTTYVQVAQTYALTLSQADREVAEQVQQGCA